ncbi:MAG: sulfotransferase domain-containing protein [Pseudomonadota bacterium]
MTANLTGYPPKVFLIGAQKSGTTNLAGLMGQHPKVCLATPKEPDIFTRHWTGALGPIDQHFPDANPEQILLDASTSYTCAPLPDLFAADKTTVSRYSGAAERIYDHAPDARLIYIMRNPIERTYSAYWHKVRAGEEKREFREAIRSDSYYLRTSHYAGQLNQYLRHFPKNQILCLFFEALRKNPIETAKRCFQFIGVSDDIPLQPNRGQNKSFAYPGPLQRLNRILQPIGGLNRVVKATKRIMPRAVLEGGASILTRPVPKIDAEDARWLRRETQGSLAPLEEILGEVLPEAWLGNED